MTKPITSLTWGCDCHLEWVSQREVVDFARQLADYSGEGLLLTGDISAAERLLSDLGIIAKAFKKGPVYWLHGNHHFWSSSFQRVREITEELKARFDNLVFLDGRTVHPLTEKTALIGISGWADGQAASGGELRCVSTTTERLRT